MEQLLFKYPLEVYAQGRLILASDWPLWWLYLLAGIGLMAVAASVLRPALQLGATRRAIIAVTQGALVLLVLVLLWQPALELNRLREQVNSIVMLVDGSASMAYTDDGVRRYDRARDIAGHDAITRLSQQYHLRRLQFADQAVPLDEAQAVSDSGTRLVATIEEVLGRRSSESLAAVLVVSDGNDEQGRLAPAQLTQLVTHGVPVHTVTVGRERVPEDVGIAGIVMPLQVVPGSAIRTRVDISHDAAHRVVLNVRSADRILSVTEHALEQGRDQTSVWINLALSAAGHHAVDFELQPVAGESNLRNNRLTRMVEVAGATLNVLYIEGEPRWEYKFLRRAVADDRGLALRSLLRVSPNRFYRQGLTDGDQLADGFPVEREVLFGYDALIIGSIEAASFDDSQLQMIRDFVAERGGGLLMLGGRAGLGEGGWGGSAVAGVLPAALPPAGSSSFQRIQVPVLPVRGAGHALLPRFDADPAIDRQLWQDLPALADFQRLGALKPAARVLLQMRTEAGATPLLVHQPYGLGQVYLLASGGTWRWQMSLPVEDLRHEQFWRQLLRKLGENALRQYSLSSEVQGQEVVISAELRHADYSPDERPALDVLVTEGSGAAQAVRLQPMVGAPGRYEARFRPAASHRVYVESAAPTDRPQPAARSAVYFDTDRAEFATMRANRAVLQSIAQATGGRNWLPEQLAALPEAIARSRAGVSETQVLPVWDAPVLFLLVLLLKTGEWLMRRRWATI